MTWNFHNYYSSSSDGLVAKLILSDTKNSELKALRKVVRTRIKDVFEEAKAVVKNSELLSIFEVRQKLVHIFTHGDHLITFKPIS